MSAPRKLADGTWSDGFTRDFPIHVMERVKRVGGKPIRRACVFRFARGVWAVDCPPDMYFATHAEAIAYADKTSRKLKK